MRESNRRNNRNQQKPTSEHPARCGPSCRGFVTGFVLASYRQPLLSYLSEKRSQARCVCVCVRLLWVRTCLDLVDYPQGSRQRWAWQKTTAIRPKPFVSRRGHSETHAPIRLVHEEKNHHSEDILLTFLCARQAKIFINTVRPIRARSRGIARQEDIFGKHPRRCEMGGLGFSSSGRMHLYPSRQSSSAQHRAKQRCNKIGATGPSGMLSIRTQKLRVGQGKAAEQAIVQYPSGAPRSQNIPAWQTVFSVQDAPISLISAKHPPKITHSTPIQHTTRNHIFPSRYFAFIPRPTRTHATDRPHDHPQCVQQTQPQRNRLLGGGVTHPKNERAFI